MAQPATSNLQAADPHATSAAAALHAISDPIVKAAGHHAVSDLPAVPHAVSAVPAALLHAVSDLPAVLHAVSAVQAVAVLPRAVLALLPAQAVPSVAAAVEVDSVAVAAVEVAVSVADIAVVDAVSAAVMAAVDADNPTRKRFHTIS